MPFNEPNIDLLAEELADLAKETITALADHKISWAEVLSIADDIVDVKNAIEVLVEPDEAKRAARKARRQARRLARAARQAARDALKE